MSDPSIFDNMEDDLKNNAMHNFLNVSSSLVIFIPLTILGIILLVLLIKKIMKWKGNYTAGIKQWYEFPLIYPFSFIIKHIWNSLMYIWNTMSRTWPTIIQPFLKNYWYVILVAILALTVVIATPILLANGNAALGDWANIVSWLALVMVAFFVIATFVSQIKKDYKTEINKETWIPKTYKLAGESGRYLFYLICLSMFLALLGLIGYFLTQYEIFQMGGLFFITAICAAIIAGGIYVVGKKYLKKSLSKNPLFNIVYHAMFILPCIFVETAEYLYRELKHTPHFVYRILSAEMIILTLWYIVPYIKRQLYTWMPSRDNTASEFSEEIASYNNDNDKIDARMKIIISYTSDEYSGGIIINELEQSFWDGDMINGLLYEKKNKVELKKHIIAMGFSNNDTINRLITVVQKYGKEYQILSMRKTDQLNKIDELTKKMENTNYLHEGHLLVADSKYLNVETKIDLQHNFSNSTKNYNYDYSISLWVFLHSNNQKWKVKNKWKNILNYDKRPHVVYNIQTNTLEIRVKTGIESKERVIFKKKHFPLQKWHNIVINYNGGVVDVFLNSKLIATDSQVLPMMKHSNIILGESGGVQGGITNVIYFPAHMSRTRIETNYRLLRENPRKVP